MKKFHYCLLILFFSVSASGQKSPIKFGDIPMEDLTMTVYDKDSSASAVILTDYGEAYVLVTPSAANLTFERHVRIKILKTDGTRWANVEIPLLHIGGNEERVSGLKAVSYNLENGQVVETKMSRDGIFKEKFNKNINLERFTIPNVKEGTVLEYSYSVVSDFLANFPNWQFQYSIPVRHSEYWATLPDFLVFEKYMQGYLVVSNYEVEPRSLSYYQARAHHWVLDDVPAFQEEPYMTSENDFVSKINFALSHINFPQRPMMEIMGSWNKLNKDLLASESFGKAITGSNFLKSTVEEITLGITEPMEKLTAIHNYVTQNIEWDNTRDFRTDQLRKVLELKKGSSGDINIALASMLEKAGIQVEMVLLSTRDHGFIRKDYPMEKQFNYVVCEATIDAKPVFLDATAKYLPPGVLPERCLNGLGFRVSEFRSGWIDIQPKTKSKTVVTADLVLDSAGTLTGDLLFTRDGYDASRMRREYHAKGEETYLREQFGSKSWQITESEFSDVETLASSAKEKHRLAIREHSTLAGDVMYINPFITAQLESNPFRQSERVYPIDFGSPIEKVYMCKIAIPEGYEVDEIPQGKALMLPGNAARFIFNVSQNANSINITSSMHINKNLFIQSEYLYLKEFYNQVVAKQAEQIVLRKKMN